VKYSGGGVDTCNVPTGVPAWNTPFTEPQPSRSCVVVRNAAPCLSIVVVPSDPDAGRGAVSGFLQRDIVGASNGVRPSNRQPCGQGMLQAPSSRSCPTSGVMVVCARLNDAALPRREVHELESVPPALTAATPDPPLSFSSFALRCLFHEKSLEGGNRFARTGFETSAAFAGVLADGWRAD
jgi:hypothetical protein